MRHNPRHPELVSGSIEKPCPHWLFTLLIMAALCGLGSPVLAASERWTTYQNERFEFQFCYAVPTLTPQPESGNGDGRWFKGPKGVKVGIWGGYNALDHAIAQQADFSASVQRKAGWEITYRRLAKTWFVLSGTNDDLIFYQRTIEQNGVFITYYAEYPKAAKSDWDAQNAKMAKCLKFL